MSRLSTSANKWWWLQLISLFLSLHYTKRCWLIIRRIGCESSSNLHEWRRQWLCLSIRSFQWANRLTFVVEWICNLIRFLRTCSRLNCVCLRWMIDGGSWAPVEIERNLFIRSLSSIKVSDSRIVCWKFKHAKWTSEREKKRRKNKNVVTCLKEQEARSRSSWALKP